jgi:hypothetical protein
MLETKTWMAVKYTDPSERLDYIGNHCLAVVSDSDSFERMVMFGGICNYPSADVADVKSSLSNNTVLIQTHKNQYGSRDHGTYPPMQKQENKKYISTDSISRTRPLK